MREDLCTNGLILGGYVLAIFKDPKRWISNDLRVASEFISLKDIANIMSEVSGKPVKVDEYDKEGFERLAKSGVIPEELIAKCVRVLKLLFQC